MDYYNVRQSAKRLKVHENTIRNWCDAGRLPFVRLPGSGFRRLPKDAVEELREAMGLNDEAGEQ
jgi:excisionase family DNA binding protein